MTTAGRAMVRTLQALGIELVTTVPGESFLEVLDALYDARDMTTLTFRHESGAAFMAEGYAKMSGRPAVVMATRAVGAGNLAIGVHTARSDSTPLIVVLGQVDRKDKDREAFQEVDLLGMFRPLAKWVVEVGQGERLAWFIRRAYQEAVSGRPGPVVLIVPEDVFLDSVDMKSDDMKPDGVGMPHPMSPRTSLLSFEMPIVHGGPDRMFIDAFYTLLRESRRPAVIAGGGVRLSGARELLASWASIHQIPVYAAFRRQDSFPAEHACYAGHLGLGTPSMIAEHLSEVDLWIALGTRLSEVTTQGYTLPHPHQRLIHIERDPAVLARYPEAALSGAFDLKTFLEAITDSTFTPDASAIRVRERWCSTVKEAYLKSLQYPPKPSVYASIMQTISENLPENAVIANDAGNFAGWIHRYLPFTVHRRQIAPTSGAMGYGLPAALGAKWADPARPVIVFAGDGGLMMTVQEIATAVRYHLNVLVVVFNNALYGTIRQHQAQAYPGRVMATELSTVNFAAMAESMGALGRRVERPDAFAEAWAFGLERARGTQGLPVVLDVIVPPDEISVGRWLEELEGGKENGTTLSG